MPGYLVKQENIAIDGAADLIVRSLLDGQQYADPHGAAEALGISSAGWPHFGLLWPSALHLAAAMASRPLRPAERILELGCGLALPSLVSHRRGADVTASDRHPLAAGFLLENLRLNALAPLRYRHGDWMTAPAAARGGDAVQGRYDLIIGSDLLYERDDAGVLARFIEDHAAPTGEVLIVDPNRGNRPPFHRRMAALGYTLAESPILGAPGVANERGRYRGRSLSYRRSAPAVHRKEARHGAS